jgi:general stress protein YciG
MVEEQPKPKAKRGFASMSPEKRSEIARKGGRSVPAEKRSYSQNHDLAAKAGQKGGKAVDPKKRTFSTDRALAVAAGKKGGEASQKAARAKKP